MNYLSWDSITVTDFSEKNIAVMYSRGYVFTRLGKGAMDQTRSVRIDLKKFILSSENRRILKKIQGIELQIKHLPLADYTWSIGKLAKDFYDTKFGQGIMSAQKIKGLLTDSAQSNFNNLFLYSNDSAVLGYTIVYTGNSFLHYSYPFYDLTTTSKDIGMGMMILAIEHAKREGKDFIYLGSLQRPGDTYKLQFEGLEWFDGTSWQTDQSELRQILAQPQG